MTPTLEGLPAAIDQNWDPNKDSKYRFALPVNTLARWGWWIGQGKARIFKHIERKQSGFHYNQQASYDNYQSAELNEKETGIIASDEIRFMVHHGQLCVSYYSNFRKYVTQLLAQETRNIEGGFETLLDFGCGAGGNYLHLKQRFPQTRLYGFDYTPMRVQTAYHLCKSYGVERPLLFNSDGKKLPLKDASIDVTFTCQVLEQLNDDADFFIQEMGRITKKKIVLVEPIADFGNPAQKIYVASQGYLRGLPRRVRALKRWEIAKMGLCKTYVNPLNPVGYVILVPR